MTTTIAPQGDTRSKVTDPYEQLSEIAQSHNWHDVHSALELAYQLHDGQKRRTGGPAIHHPLRVALKLYALGVRDQYILAAALLHDVLEDCADKLNPKSLARFHAQGARTVGIVHHLTKHDPENPESYFRRIANCWQASLIKLADRADNLATMNGAFTPERAREYVEETKRYIIPLTTPTQGRNGHYPRAFQALRGKILILTTKAEKEYGFAHD